MLEDVTLNPIGMQIALTDSGDFQLVVVTGIVLPVGNGQAAQIPAKATRINIDTKKEVGEFIENLQKAYDEMPDDEPESNVLIANDLHSVNQFADQISKLK